MPIAMRLGCNLRIEAAGTEATERNAERLSKIWARWLPGHFRPISVRFAKTARPTAGVGGDICIYSGGIDSTYAMLRRHREGQRQTLLTIHGMDYRYDDRTRFADLLKKTSGFANAVGLQRIVVRTDAYRVYKQYRVNPKGSDVGHVFVLGGASFLYSERFSRAVIAADYRLDQQFDVHPWGTNAATNPLFDDGEFRLHTEDQDITRAQKCSLLLTSDEALNALTFCVDYQSRPQNCGKCQKCVRTKAMFMAGSGRIPKIFSDMSLASGCLGAFDLEKKHQRAFFFDLHETALSNGSVEAIPGLAQMYEAIGSGRMYGWRGRLRSLIRKKRY
jgi:7-cyano-7-deazaguanine synthase in queuosine biosynthesis